MLTGSFASAFAASSPPKPAPTMTTRGRAVLGILLPVSCLLSVVVCMGWYFPLMILWKSRVLPFRRVPACREAEDGRCSEAELGDTPHKPDPDLLERSCSPPWGSACQEGGHRPASATARPAISGKDRIYASPGGYSQLLKQQPLACSSWLALRLRGKAPPALPGKPTPTVVKSFSCQQRILSRSTAP